MTDLSGFVRGLPKVELHVHHVGSASPRIVADLVAPGVPVSINSDDPPMFATTLNNEYLIPARLLDLDESGVVELANTSIRAAFLSEEGKRALLREVAEYAHGAAL